MFRRPRQHVLKHEVRKSFANFVVQLVGHLLGTAITFVSLFVIGWGVSFLLHFLHGIRPEEILNIITTFERCLAYGDTILCAFVLLGGTVWFIKDCWRIGNERESYPVVC